MIALESMVAGVRDMTKESHAVSPFSIETNAFRAARTALKLCEIVTGDWGKCSDICPMTMAEHLEDGRNELLCPTDAEWQAAGIEFSKVDGSFLRVTVGRRVWIVEQDVDGGYGDDGTGQRVTYHLALEGYAK